jgi:WD40 repeat protein
VAAGGRAERVSGDSPIYLFDRKSGALIKRIHDDLPDSTSSLTFSPDGHYLAVTLAGDGGVRVFDRDKQWEEVFRDDYDGPAIGSAFAPDGRLVTTSLGSDGSIRLYDQSFRLMGKPVKAPSGNTPDGVAFSPDGRLLALGYSGLSGVDLLDGYSLAHVAGPRYTYLTHGPYGLSRVAWSRDGQTLFAAGSVREPGRDVFLAWSQAGLGEESRLTYCDKTSNASKVDVYPPLPE